jgi:hypothetical protein
MPYKDKKQKAAYDVERRALLREDLKQAKKTKYSLLTSEEKKARSERGRAGNLRRKYGITIEQWNEILARQGGVCAICKGPPNGVGRYHVDHDHRTGQVRGLLCYKHNALLGFADDQIEVLQASIDYLKGIMTTCSQPLARNARVVAGAKSTNA